MPISALDGCSDSHWIEVREILSEAIESAGFKPNLVSSAEEVGTIQKRIVQNLYDNPIVVCDISGRNPNVMFELGLRLAFDKPTVIVKDDATPFAFDTSVIEHIQYPRSLRFSQIVEFKDVLAKKIGATVQAAESDPAYSTFLKHFGEFKRPLIDQREVSAQEYLLEELHGLRESVRRLAYSAPIRRPMSDFYFESAQELERKQKLADLNAAFVPLEVSLAGLATADQVEIQELLSRTSSVKAFSVDPNSRVVTAWVSRTSDRDRVEKLIDSFVASKRRGRDSA
jgi:hypothetical protein